MVSFKRSDELLVSLVQSVTILDDRSIFSTTFNSRLIVTFGKSGRGELVSIRACLMLTEDGLTVMVVGSLESVDNAARCEIIQNSMCNVALTFPCTFQQ